MSEIARWLGLPDRRPMNLPPGYHVARRVSAFERNDKCRAWSDSGWEGRERNLTDENMEKARKDAWRHYRRENPR